MEDQRVREFAHFLIAYSVSLKKGEKILIEVHGPELQLTRALIEEAYKAGGKPFLHIIDYKLERALMRGVDAAHMADIASYELDRMKDMDAYIGLRAAENSSEWNDVGDDKVAIYRKHYWGPLHLDERCNHTKWAVLRYPNDAMAQLAKMSTEEFEDYFFDACLFDYGKMGKVEVKEIGEETITVGGKTYTCKLTETIVDMGGKKSVTKLWQSEEVPSGTVKSVTQNDMMTSTVELVEYGKK